VVRAPADVSQIEPDQCEADADCPPQRTLIEHRVGDRHEGRWERQQKEPAQRQPITENLRVMLAPATLSALESDGFYAGRATITGTRTDWTTALLTDPKKVRVRTLLP